jgi:predicted Zn-dependent protease with MMP-like domain
MSADWKRLLTIAQDEVASTLASLPAHLQTEARRLPVTCEPRPNEALLRDQVEPDTLGLFVGPEFAQESNVPLPSQIILFLENLWELAEGDEEIFRDEVRTTYLHELGHYLGLDEDGLFERGLE